MAHATRTRELMQALADALAEEAQGGRDAADEPQAPEDLQEGDGWEEERHPHHNHAHNHVSQPQAETGGDEPGGGEGLPAGLAMWHEHDEGGHEHEHGDNRHAHEHHGHEHHEHDEDHEDHEHHEHPEHPEHGLERGEIEDGPRGEREPQHGAQVYVEQAYSAREQRGDGGEYDRRADPRAGRTAALRQETRHAAEDRGRDLLLLLVVLQLLRARSG